MVSKINADTSDGLKITSDTSGTLDIQSGGTTKMTVGSTIDLQGNELVLDADADTSIHADTDDQIDFKTGGTDRVTITSAGNINLTTGIINTVSNDFRIQINGENRYKTEPANGIHRFYSPDEGIFMFSNETGTNASLFKGHNSATDANGSNAVACFVVFANGNVQNTNNSYGATSDLTLKENISDSSSQWEDIKSVKVKKYSMKADNLDSANQIGVIAQDLESSGMNGLVETIDDVKSVKYSVLYMKAVKALQEAMTRIETLEAKVTALESE